MMNLMIVIFNWDYWDMPNIFSQIVGSIIGAFLGFILAIKLSKDEKNKRSLELMKELLFELENEFKNSELTKKKIATNVTDIQLFYLPTMEKLISSNTMLLWGDLELYNKIKIMMIRINRLNHWYATKNDFWLQNSSKIDIDATIKGLNFDQSIRDLLTADKDTNKYIAFCKTMWDDIKEIFFEMNNLILLLKSQTKNKASRRKK